MSGQRIEQIRKRAQRISVSSGWEMSEAGSMECEAFRVADQDVFYLVRRLEELEQKLEAESAVRFAHSHQIAELEAENQRLRATLEKREEHLAEVRRGGEWFTDAGEVVEREMGPEGAAF